MECLGSLLAITFSEFDNKVGPKLKYSYPSDVLSNDVFESFADYVIMSKQLCEKVIIVYHDMIQFMNYSVAIENAKYGRNTLIFAFGFVLGREVETAPYEAALRKISSVFINLELEAEYLFSPTTNQKIPNVLQVLFHKLRYNSEAVVDMAINNSYLAVKLFKNSVLKSSQNIEDYHVPAFRFDKIDLALLPWDVTFQHLIPQIDGVTNVKRIAKQAQMDVLVAKRCIQLLVFHGCVLVTDAVRFSNVYRIHTDVALQMFSDSDLMSEILSFSSLEGATTGDNDPTAQAGVAAPTNEQLIQFYIKFKPGKKLRDIVLDAWDETHSSSAGGSSNSSSDGMPFSRSTSSFKSSSSTSSSSNFTRAIKTAASTPSSSSKNSSNGATGSASPLRLAGLNVCRAVVIGQARGILNRMHEYPIYCSTTQTSAVVSSQSLSHALSRNSTSSSADTMTSGASEKKMSTLEGCMKPHHDYSSSSLTETEKNRKTLTFTDGTKPGLSHSPPSFTRLHSKSKSFSNKLILSHINHSLPASSSSSSSVGQDSLEDSSSPSLPTSSSCGYGILSLEELARSLTGEHSLEYICCEYNVSPQDILNFPGIIVVYK